MLSIAHSRRRRRRLEWSVLATVLLGLVAWLSTPDSLGRVNHLVQDAGLVGWDAGPLENAVSTCLLEHLHQIGAWKALRPHLGAEARRRSRA